MGTTTTTTSTYTAPAPTCHDSFTYDYGQYQAPLETLTNQLAQCGKNKTAYDGRLRVMSSTRTGDKTYTYTYTLMTPETPDEYCRVDKEFRYETPAVVTANDSPPINAELCLVYLNHRLRNDETRYILSAITHEVQPLSVTPDAKSETVIHGYKIVPRTNPQATR